MARLISVAVALSLVGVTGCTQRVPYPALGTWTAEVQKLGPVSSCQGGHCCPNDQCQWPLALPVPPPTESYHRALVDDAVARYAVPAHEVVLDQVLVTLHTEMVGTVRGWAAEAIAGRKAGLTSPAGSGASAKQPIEERLKRLDDLQKQGVITEQELQQRRSEILKEL